MSAPCTCLTIRNIHMTCLPTRGTLLSTPSTRLLTRSARYSIRFVCPFAAFVYPLIVSVCPLLVLAVLSVTLFITDHFRRPQLSFHIISTHF